MASRFAPAAPNAQPASDRYLIVPCEAEGCGDLAVIWDRLEEQVVDVIAARAAMRWSEEDAMYDEMAARPARRDAVAHDWRMAA